MTTSQEFSPAHSPTYISLFPSSGPSTVAAPGPFPPSPQLTDSEYSCSRDPPLFSRVAVLPGIDASSCSFRNRPQSATFAAPLPCELAVSAPPTAFHSGPLGEAIQQPRTEAPTSLDHLVLEAPFSGGQFVEGGGDRRHHMLPNSSPTNESIAHNWAAASAAHQLKIECSEREHAKESATGEGVRLRGDQRREDQQIEEQMDDSSGCHRMDLSNVDALRCTTDPYGSFSASDVNDPGAAHAPDAISGSMTCPMTGGNDASCSSSVKRKRGTPANPLADAITNFCEATLASENMPTYASCEEVIAAGVISQIPRRATTTADVLAGSGRQQLETAAPANGVTGRPLVSRQLLMMGFDIRLGEAGRAVLKREISRRMKLCPKIRHLCSSAVCRLKNANVHQLLEMAEIAGCLHFALMISNSHWNQSKRAKYRHTFLPLDTPRSSVHQMSHPSSHMDYRPCINDPMNSAVSLDNIENTAPHDTLSVAQQPQNSGGLQLAFPSSRAVSPISTASSSPTSSHPGSPTGGIALELPSGATQCASSSPAAFTSSNMSGCGGTFDNTEKTEIQESGSASGESSSSPPTARCKRRRTEHTTMGAAPVASSPSSPYSGCPPRSGSQPFASSNCNVPSPRANSKNQNNTQIGLKPEPPSSTPAPTTGGGSLSLRAASASSLEEESRNFSPTKIESRPTTVSFQEAGSDASLSFPSSNAHCQRHQQHDQYVGNAVLGEPRQQQALNTTTTSRIQIPTTAPPWDIAADSGGGSPNNLNGGTRAGYRVPTSTKASSPIAGSKCAAAKSQVQHHPRLCKISNPESFPTTRKRNGSGHPIGGKKNVTLRPENFLPLSPPPRSADSFFGGSSPTANADDLLAPNPQGISADGPTIGTPISPTAHPPYSTNVADHIDATTPDFQTSLSPDARCDINFQQIDRESGSVHVVGCGIHSFTNMGAAGEQVPSEQLSVRTVADGSPIVTAVISTPPAQVIGPPQPSQQRTVPAFEVCGPEAADIGVCGFTRTDACGGVGPYSGLAGVDRSNLSDAGSIGGAAMGESAVEHRQQFAAEWMKDNGIFYDAADSGKNRWHEQLHHDNQYAGLGQTDNSRPTTASSSSSSSFGATESTLASPSHDRMLDDHGRRQSCSGNETSSPSASSISCQLHFQHSTHYSLNNNSDTPFSDSGRAPISPSRNCQIVAGPGFSAPLDTSPGLETPFCSRNTYGSGSLSAAGGDRDTAKGRMPLFPPLFSPTQSPCFQGDGCREAVSDDAGTEDLRGDEKSESRSTEEGRNVQTVSSGNFSTLDDSGACASTPLQAAGQANVQETAKTLSIPPTSQSQAPSKQAQGNHMSSSTSIINGTSLLTNEPSVSSELYPASEAQHTLPCYGLQTLQASQGVMWGHRRATPGQLAFNGAAIDTPEESVDFRTSPIRQIPPSAEQSAADFAHQQKRLHHFDHSSGNCEAMISSSSSFGHYPTTLHLPTHAMLPAFTEEHAPQFFTPGIRAFPSLSLPPAATGEFDANCAELATGNYRPVWQERQHALYNGTFQIPQHQQNYERGYFGGQPHLSVECGAYYASGMPAGGAQLHPLSSYVNQNGPPNSCMTLKAPTRRPIRADGLRRPVSSAIPPKCTPAGASINKVPLKLTKNATGLNGASKEEGGRSSSRHSVDSAESDMSIRRNGSESGFKSGDGTAEPLNDLSSGTGGSVLFATGFLSAPGSRLKSRRRSVGSISTSSAKSSASSSAVKSSTSSSFISKEAPYLLSKSKVLKISTLGKAAPSSARGIKSEKSCAGGGRNPFGARNAAAAAAAATLESNCAKPRCKIWRRNAAVEAAQRATAPSNKLGSAVLPSPLLLRRSGPSGSILSEDGRTRHTATKSRTAASEQWRMLQAHQHSDYRGAFLPPLNHQQQPQPTTTTYGGMVLSPMPPNTNIAGAAGVQWPGTYVVYSAQGTGYGGGEAAGSAVDAMTITS